MKMSLKPFKASYYKEDYHRRAKLNREKAIKKWINMNKNNMKENKNA